MFYSHKAKLTFFSGPTQCADKVSYFNTELLIESEKDSWCADSSKELMAKFLEITQGEEAKLNYMQENIEVDEFRSVFIENAIKVKDYQEAIRLIEDVSSKSKNRQEERWLRYLLDIYILVNDKEKVIRFSREILLLTHKDVNDCYAILKKYVPNDEWHDFIKALYIDAKKSGYQNYKLTNLAIWEEDWDMYLNILRKSYDYNHISAAENHLPKKYYPQLAHIYRGAILKNMEIQKGRTYYQRATKLIRRIIKLGERKIAEELILELRSKYKIRRALIEELDNV